MRSTLKTARYSQPPLDLERIAADLAVDVVLTGSLLVSPRHVRVTAELVSVPAGDVWWSHVTDAAPDGVLELHDDIARRVLAALPLSARDHGAPPRARAANEKAFDLYLRGMQLRAEAGAWRQAHAFFVQSLQHDPTFAAAWAERGRLERILGKFEDPAALAEAESSFRQALALDPDNGAAQHYYAQLEIDLGRVDASLARLLDRAWQRRAEPHIYAALVHACRYGGLLDASVAAHRTAARLDPTVRTSVLHTYYLQGDFPRALEEAHRSSDPFEPRLLGAMGRRDEALAAARREETRFAAVPLLRAFSTGMRAAMEGRRDEALEALQRFVDSRFRDGEGLFYVAEILAMLDLPERAFAMLNRAVDAGFLCLPAFERDAYLAPLRASDDWRRSWPGSPWRRPWCRASSIAAGGARCSEYDPTARRVLGPPARRRRARAAAILCERPVAHRHFRRDQSTSAVSLTVRPPKQRSSTTWLLRASSARPSASRASSRATESWPGAGDATSTSSSGTTGRRCRRVSGSPSRGPCRRGCAASCGPRRPGSGRDSASGRASPRPAGGRPRSRAPWAAGCVPGARRACSARPPGGVRAPRAASAGAARLPRPRSRPAAGR